MQEKIERFLKPQWVRVVCLLLVALGSSLYLYWPGLRSYPLTPWGDGQKFQRVIDAAKVSISRYRELPLWNPFECAGAPLWDEPESIVAAPLILLLQPLSATLTMRIWNIAHHAAGFVCMWLFSRQDLRLSRSASLIASMVFALSAAHVRQYGGGHAALVGFVYAPLALLLWRRAERDLRFAVGLGLLFAWIFYEGGCYPVPYLGLMLVLESATRMSRRRALDLLRAGAVALAGFVTVGAARLFPVIDQLRHHTRALGPETDALSLHVLGAMFFAPPHEGRVPGQAYVFSEYGSYIGVTVGVLALLGLALSIRDRPWLLVLGGSVFLLMMGHFASWAPWHLLKEHVFPWSSMRVPSRFRLIFLLFIAGWTGLAIDRAPPLLSRFFRHRVARMLARAAVLGVALMGTRDAVSAARSVIPTLFVDAPEARVRPSAHLFIGGRLAAFIDQPRQNQGRTTCWEEWDFTANAPVWGEDVPQARTRDDDVVVEDVTRTQNTFTIEVDAKAPGRVMVNSPFERGWRTDVGTIADEGKLLVVDVPKGRTTVHLKYWPHGLTAGFVVTPLGVLAVVAFFVWDARRRKTAGPRRADPPAAAA